MEDFKLKFNSDCRLSRSERRAYERKIFKAEKKTITIPSNQAFDRIKPALIDKGWIFHDNFGNLVELGDYMSAISSPALRLVNEIFNVTLIPHKSGIEISRLEVWEKYQQQGLGGAFLENLLKYLINFDIEEIVVLPLPAGFRKSNQSLEKKQAQLQRFFRKRGFIPNGTQHFSLNIELFRSLYQGMDVDNSMLTKIPKAFNPNKLAHLVKVHFEFVCESDRNFIEEYEFQGYEHIKETLKRFIKDLPNDDFTSRALHILLTEAMESNKISEELSEALNSLFGMLLADFAEMDNYQKTMKALGGIYAGLLFLIIGGIENDIDGFCFKFDQTHRTLDIGTHSAKGKEIIINPYNLN